MIDEIQRKLHAFYDDKSKHSNYQSIPAFVRERLGYKEVIDEGWRGDTARLAFIRETLDFTPGAHFGDVGANTGFFTLSLAHLYPECSFVALEVNPRHAEHIRLIIEAFNLKNVTVQSLAVDLAGVDSLPQFDTLLHLNVLHHAGHDFDKGLVASPDEITDYALAYLSKLAPRAGRLVFQIGYNWGGDKAKPILLNSDQTGMVMWLNDVFGRSGWIIETIAFATRDHDRQIRYLPLSDEFTSSDKIDGVRLQNEIDTFNLDQFPGEFYRRPIVICRSAKGFSSNGSIA